MAHVPILASNALLQLIQLVPGSNPKYSSIPLLTSGVCFSALSLGATPFYHNLSFKFFTLHSCRSACLALNVCCLQGRLTVV
ncbi:hypothetical protein F5Y17DRAFT_426787 [Xylariaceae sp. FL0594]|nr:hypothetical protein F5Y17DRAFT_426787 [Xylariaceae sp. FL0594]